MPRNVASVEDTLPEIDKDSLRLTQKGREQVCLLFNFFYFVLFCFVLLLCFVLFCFVLFCFVLFCFVLFCFVLFCFVLFCFVLFCFVLFCFVLFTILYLTILMMNCSCEKENERHHFSSPLPTWAIPLHGQYKAPK